MPTQQLPLRIALRDEATFDNFYAAPGSPNELVKTALQKQLTEAGNFLLYCWGSEGSGLTHLLQAACHTAGNKNHSAQYLPLAHFKQYEARELFDQLDQVDLLCLDDVHSVLGEAAWEQELFHLINRVRDQNNHLLMAADHSPMQLPLQRDDLRSRFGWGAVFQVHQLKDEEKKAALQLRATLRGLNMSDDVANFILSHAPRKTSELFLLLEKLDQLSLQQQRRLTIPLVKEAIKQSPQPTVDGRR